MKGSKITGHKATLLIIDDLGMPIQKPTQFQNAQKKALKLFAGGYRPLKNTAFPRIGRFDYSKIRSRFYVITPIVLKQCAGVNAYTIDRRDVSSEVYYALVRLTKNATIGIYRTLCEQLNEIS